MLLIILPNQLFPVKMLELDKYDKICLLEEPRYFTDFKFHKMKLMYHRASMKTYQDKLKIDTIYKEYYEVNKYYKTLNNSNTVYIDPIDHKLSRKYKKVLSKATKIDNLNFLLTPQEVHENKDEFYTNNKYSHEMFYKFQRKKLNILMDKDKPEGGKWSYDEMNRLPLPKNITIPKVPKIKKDKYYHEALEYVEKHFPKNYGSTEEWLYPINTKDALKWLECFMEKRLKSFGPYEDAISFSEPFLFHSVLSPMMNIGLLPDIYVVRIVDEYYRKHSIPLQSYEGFIRQVIGWRNYVYSIYILEPKMYNMNHLGHTRKLKDHWKDDMEPINTIIEKINKYSYAHHIERLMFLSNWYLINMIKPKDVYRAFMEWTIDAYDWVMVPNVMGMGQYADGGMTMTRIYFSSSNYIIKMGGSKKGEWSEIWDCIYYNFINKHYDLLKRNYATARQCAHWKKKTEKEKEIILKKATVYIKDHA
jgi:deoxyribodipyrimidine photolyase-related protein